MCDFVNEENCAVCSKTGPNDREALRRDLSSVQLREPVCNACLMAFWRNIGFPVSDDKTEH